MPKIPPNLPLQREEIPLFGKEGRGEISRGPSQINFESLNKIPFLPGMNVSKRGSSVKGRKAGDCEGKFS